MELCILGSQRTEAARAFERFLSSKGCKAQLTLMDGPVPNIGPSTGGIVIFDDGVQPIDEWVAHIRHETRYLTVPLVGVTHQGKGNERLLSAGVTTVCDADAGHETILSKLQEQSSRRPVEGPVRDSLLEPFVLATTTTLREMAGTDVACRSIYQKTNYRMFGDVSAVIGFMAPREGALVLSFPDPTAQALVGRILADVTDLLDEDMIRDCVGEICNVIAGQAKGILAGTPYHFSFSTPTIVSGSGHEIRHKQGTMCHVIAFGSDAGDFAVQLCMDP